jgi:hypothetical protein
MARGVGTLPVTPSPVLVLVHPTHPPPLPPPVATDGDGCCPDSHIRNQTKRRTKTRNATSTYVVSGEDLPTPTKDVSVSPVGGGGGGAFGGSLSSTVVPSVPTWQILLTPADDLECMLVLCTCNH